MPKVLITPETARHFHELNRIAKAKRKAESLASATAISTVPIQSDYASRCLARTRAQLDLVAAQITAALQCAKLDERKLKTLTEAQDRLQEAERKLAGRPLPGSHRPRQAGQTLPVAGAWLDDVPAQVVQVVPPVPEVAQPTASPGPSEPTVQPLALSQSVSQSEPEVHNPEQKQG